MTTKSETLKDLEHARAILDGARDHLGSGGLLLFSIDYGTGLTDYLRAVTILNWYGREGVSNLTWAMSKVFGYSLRDRAGYYHLAVSGYGFSKQDQLARELADYYGLSDLNHATI